MYEVVAKAQHALPGDKVVNDGDFHTLRKVEVDKDRNLVVFKFHKGAPVKHTYDTKLTFQRPLTHRMHWSEVPAGAMVMRGTALLATGQVVPMRPIK